MRVTNGAALFSGLLSLAGGLFFIIDGLRSGQGTLRIFGGLCFALSSIYSFSRAFREAGHDKPLD